MRTRPTKERAESRVVNCFHKLYERLIELLQSLEDALPEGMQLGDGVELTARDGELVIRSKARPARIVIYDKDRAFTIEVGSVAQLGDWVTAHTLPNLSPLLK